MTGSSCQNKACKADDSIIEINNNFNEKLNIAELVLKTLDIKYQIRTSKTCTSNLKDFLFRKSLNQVQEELIKL
ncbi:MAG: hypothetical protein ACFE9N_15230 [Promethearchaeota archaeon]